jgi:hypothetical protein
MSVYCAYQLLLHTSNYLSTKLVMYLCVQLKEGPDNAAPDTELMSKQCGSEIPGPIHSSKNRVYVHFVTDSSRNFPGFRLEWVVDGKQ